MYFIFQPPIVCSFHLLFLQQRMVSLISPPRFTSLHLYFANVVNFALSNHLFSRKTFKKLKKNTI